MNKITIQYTQEWEPQSGARERLIHLQEETVGEEFLTLSTAPHTLTGGRQVRGDQAISARSSTEPKYLWRSQQSMQSSTARHA
jgi:hypothetical protein